MFPLLFALTSPAFADDLVLRRRPRPRHPDPSVVYAQCLVRVWMGTDGRPYETEAKGCPPLFADEASRAVGKWRWKPPTWEGKPTKAQTAVAVTFLLRGDPPPPPRTCGWEVAVGGDGSVSPLREPSPPCTGWLTKSFAANDVAGITGTCTVSFLGSDRAHPDLSACPGPAAEIGRLLVSRGTFSPAVLTRLIVTFPTDAPAESPAP